MRLPVLTAFALFCSILHASAQTPGPPTSLTVTVNADRSLTLQWTAPTTGGAPTGYLVQIGTASGASDLLNDQTGNITTYTTAQQFDAGATLYVRVRALNGSGISGPSNEVFFTIACSTPTQVPTAVTWRMLTATNVQITWVPPSPSPYTNFKIEVGTASGLSNVAVVFSGSNRRTYATVTLPGAGTFFARVRGTGGCSGIEGPASTEIQIQATGVASPPSTTIVVNEFNSFIELKNISTGAVSVGGWRIQTTTGFDQIGVLAATIRGGVTIPPGCTYLMVAAGDPTVLIPADEPLSTFVSEGVAIVRTDGFVVDSAGRRNSFDIADPNTPFIEGNPLRARRDTPSGTSFARAGDVDTNDNATDFVELTTAIPQNASGCGQTAPGPPSGLTATLLGSSINLSWTAPTTGSAPTGYIVQIGTTSGASDVLNQRIGNVTSYLTPALAARAYFVRVIAFNGAGASAASNEVTITVTTSPGPGTGAPTNLAVTVNGSTVTLTWSAPTTGSVPTQYVLEAGTSSGSSNAGVFTLAASPTAATFANVPNGTFYVRIRAVSAAGTSPPSNEVVVIVCATPCTAPPGAVTNLTFQVNGNNVLLSWTAPTSGASPTGYVIEAGTAPGLSNLGQFPTNSTVTFVIVSGVPPGTYFVRVRAAASGVLGPPSNEVVIVVP